MENITLIFHNEGLRSYIELDLCAKCPRQDDKGCCGYYSPVFYPLDLAFLYINKREVIDYVFTLPNITVLDTSVTINNTIEGESYRCRFHSKETGCLLPQHLRESVCRIFVCPGVGWWEEISLKRWQIFFEQLNAYEIDLNKYLSTKLLEKGLNLRRIDQREKFFAELIPLYKQEIAKSPDFFSNVPKTETINIKRPIFYKKEWTL